MVVCLEQGADCLHMVQLMPLHPKTPSSLASLKSRLVLRFWYWLTQIVLEKPLNWCSSSSRNYQFFLLIQQLQCFVFHITCCVSLVSVVSIFFLN